MKRGLVPLVLAVGVLDGCFLDYGRDPALKNDAGNADLGKIGCTIGSTHFTDGDLNPANSCQSCQVSVSSSQWTAREVGSVCDDGISTSCPCRSPAACNSSGTCVGNFQKNDATEKSNWPPITQPPPDSAYKTIAGEAVLDTQTCLMWRLKSEIGTYTWNAAMAICDTPFAGYSGWRLPTQTELRSLVVDGKNPAINAVFSPYPPDANNDWFWTSTPADPGTAVIVHFYSGIFYRTDIGKSGQVRCVR